MIFDGQYNFQNILKMNKILGIFLLLSLATFINAQGQDQAEPLPEQKYEIKDNVMILSEETAQQAIDEFPLIIIKFFAPWCGHCKSLAPTWIDIGKTMMLAEDIVQVASIDCTVHGGFCQKQGIRGYPTLKYFIDGEAHQYAGRRGHDEIVEWLKNKPEEVRNQREAQQM